MSLLVLGLGNPGRRYLGTRHNVGFHTIDALISELTVGMRRPLLRRYLVGRTRVNGHTVFCAKPLTFMNRSGEVVPALLRKARVEPSHMVVVCDNLDLPVGKTRLKRAGSSGGHRGLQSIIDNVGTSKFPRLYIGIGRPPVREDVISYVLERPTDDEKAALEQAYHASADAIVKLTSVSIEKVMNELNQRS